MLSFIQLSVETVLLDKESLYFTWPDFKEDDEQLEEEEMMWDDNVCSEFGLQVWDNALDENSSVEMIFTDEEQEEVPEEMDKFGEYLYQIQEILDDVFQTYRAPLDEMDDEEDECPERETKHEEVEDLFAPKIDSLREILDADYEGKEKEQQLPQVVESEISKITHKVESVMDSVESDEDNGVEDQFEDDIVVVGEIDELINLLPTPVTSDMSLLTEEAVDGAETPTERIESFQQLHHTLSLADVRVIPHEPEIVETIENFELENNEYWSYMPGIGPVVPPDVVEEFVNFIQEVSLYQSNTVMPRNLLQCSCPPLEITSKDELF